VVIRPDGEYEDQGEGPCRAVCRRGDAVRDVEQLFRVSIQYF
jgi:hypothetical protein